MDTHEIQDVFKPNIFQNKSIAMWYVLFFIIKIVYSETNLRILLAFDRVSLCADELVNNMR